MHEAFRFGRHAHIRGERGRGPASVDGNLRPLIRESFGDGAAEAAGRAAHEGDATGQAEVHAQVLAGPRAGSIRTAQIFSSAIFA